MRHSKKILMIATVLFCGITTTSCVSMLKGAQAVKLFDENNTIIGKIGGFKIHYAANAETGYPEDHYSIAITNANMGNVGEDTNIPTLSTEDLKKVTAIGVVSKTTNKYVTSSTDAKYMCDQSIDPESPGFGCRFPSADLGETKIVFIKLKLEDNTFWTSEELDLTIGVDPKLSKVTESTEIDADINKLMEGIGSGEVQMYTLKTCSDASGKKVDVKTSEDCPTGMASGIGEDTKPKTDPSTNKDCPPPNFLDTAGKCISILQTQKQCDANTVSLLDGTCGDVCGANQVQKMGKCQCQTGYMKDAKGTGCDADPNYNVTPPPGASVGGGSCSLIRME